jgi:hypothetical protein
MTNEMERIGKILIEKGEGGCWHIPVASFDGIPFIRSDRRECAVCKKWIPVKSWVDFTVQNPDFSEWANFGRLLKIADKKKVGVKINFWAGFLWIGLSKKYPEWYPEDVSKLVFQDNNQIPALVATELARIVAESK